MVVKMEGLRDTITKRNEGKVSGVQRSQSPEYSYHYTDVIWTGRILGSLDYAYGAQV